MKILADITKQEVVDFFNKYIHYSSPTRAKVSVHLRSQKPRPKKISLAAVTAFVQLLTEQGCTVDLSRWQEELFASGEPEMAQASAYWSRILVEETSGVSADVAKKTLGELPRLAQAHPAQADYEWKIK